VSARHPSRLATAVVGVVSVAGTAVLAVSIDGSVAEPIEVIELDRHAEPLRPVPLDPIGSETRVPTGGLVTPAAELASPPSATSASSVTSPASVTSTPSVGSLDS
jgi:hypothetical protein